MNANHTPGPWLIDAEDMQQNEDTVFSIGIWSGEGEGRSMVAHISAFGLHSEARGDVVVYSPMEAEQREIDEAKANARLIAAAPLLLEALEKLVRDADAEPDGEYLQGANKGCVAVNRRGIEAARAAIAAATN